jgi:DNA-binding response OmpR family regulator
MKHPHEARRVLVVGEDAELASLLRAAGYDVRICPVGPAVAKVRAFGPHAILVALDSEGVEVAQRLRRDPAILIAITASEKTRAWTPGFDYSSARSGVPTLLQRVLCPWKDP